MIEPSRAPSGCAVCYSPFLRRIRACGKNFLACDKIFSLNFMPSLSSLIFPSEHDRQRLVPLTQNFNPTPRSGCVVPTQNIPLITQEAPGESAHPKSGVEVNPQPTPWHLVPLLPILQPLTSADVGVKQLRRWHERIKEQS